MYSLHRDRLKMLDRWDPEVWCRGYRPSDNKSGTNHASGEGCSESAASLPDSGHGRVECGQGTNSGGGSSDGTVGGALGGDQCVVGSVDSVALVAGDRCNGGELVTLSDNLHNTSDSILYLHES